MCRARGLEKQGRPGLDPVKVTYNPWRGGSLGRSGSGGSEVGSGAAILGSTAGSVGTQVGSGGATEKFVLRGRGSSSKGTADDPGCSRLAWRLQAGAGETH